MSHLPTNIKFLRKHLEKFTFAHIVQSTMITILFDVHCRGVVQQWIGFYKVEVILGASVYVSLGGGGMI